MICRKCRRVWIFTALTDRKLPPAVLSELFGQKAGKTGLSPMGSGILNPEPGTMHPKS